MEVSCGLPDRRRVDGRTSVDIRGRAGPLNVEDIEDVEVGVFDVRSCASSCRPCLGGATRDAARRGGSDGTRP